MIAVIGVIISIFLAYLAYQNYKVGNANFYVQKDKLRLDLFDKRYKVFRAFQDLFATYIPSGTFTRKDLFKFANESSDAEFLFGKEVKDYIDEVYKKALRLIHLNERLINQVLVDDEKNKVIEEMANLEDWFLNQLQDSKNLFRKYLHFSIDKKP